MWLKKREVGAFGLDSRKKRGKGGKRSSRVPTARAGRPLWRRARTSPRRGKRRTTSPSNEDEDFLHFRLRFPTAGLPPRLFASAAADLTTARCSLELAPGER